MATKIGVRQFRDQASKVLKRVSERRETFEICSHDRVVARLVPVEEEDTLRARKAAVEEWSRKVDELAAQIGAHWQGPADSVAIMREERAPYGERGGNSGY